MKFSALMISLLMIGIGTSSPALLKGLFSQRILLQTPENPIQNQRRSPTVFQTYIALETKSPEMQKLSRNVMFYLSRRSHQQWVAVDLFAGSTVQNLYSNQASRQSLQALIHQIAINESSDQALIQAVQRFKDEVEQNPEKSIYGLIITQGSSNPETLKNIGTICQKLSKLSQANKQQTLRLHLIGLAPEHRLAMSQAVSSMGDRVHFASRTYEEWNQLIQF
jgi:hypothetical protein